MENYIVKTAQFAMHIFLSYLNGGDIVVDCTCGNGYDTLEIAKSGKGKGGIFSFDIQPLAIEQARILMGKEQVGMDGVTFICDTHKNLDQYIKDEIGGAIFNLGYLPGGDKQIMTKGEDTVVAVEKALKLLRVNGLVALVTYPGHEGGKKEHDLLLKYSKELDRKKYHVAFIDMINQKKIAPAIILITKKC